MRAETRLNLYWRLRALPVDVITSMIQTLSYARQGGPVAQALGLVSLVQTTATLLVGHGDFNHHLAAAGYQSVSGALIPFLESVLKKAPDLRVSGRGAGTKGALAVLRSEAMGLIALPDHNEVYVQRDRFAAWADRELWVRGVIDVARQHVPTERTGGLLRSSHTAGDIVLMPAAAADRLPAPTSNPTPEQIAELMATTDAPVLVAMLIGPSGSGKSLTAQAASRLIGRGGRLLRIVGDQNIEPATLLDLVRLLRPSCLLLDDLPVLDTAPAMQLLDLLRGYTEPLLVLITVMHDGDPMDARIPGLRPERVDVFTVFGRPSVADRVTVLMAHGLDQERAVACAGDPRMDQFTGAYLAELARRLLRGGDVNQILDNLVLQVTIAGCAEARARGAAPGWLTLASNGNSEA